MKRHFLIIIFITIVFSCNNASKNTQKDLLPESKMVEVLLDIHIAEAKVSEMKLNKDTAFAIYQELENEIWKKHQLDKAKFVKTKTFYINNLDLYENLYKKIIDSLGVMESYQNSLR